MVCPYSLTIPGGVQNQVLGLARALRTIGHEVRVLAPCDGPPPDSGVTALGNSVPFASNGSVAPVAPDFVCALRTIRAIRDGDFDVVHIHEPLCPGPPLTSLLFTDRPTVGTFHRSGGSALYEVFKPIARLVGRQLTMRTAVSVDAEKTIAAVIGGEYERVFNAIDIDRYVKASPWPTEGPTVFFIGRHEPRKGLDVLLEAMRDLSPDVRLWVASDGPQTEELRGRFEGDDRIEWLGRISDDEAASRLRAADVFCAPSLHGESFGIVLLEAMAAQTAIVASDLPGYRNVARPDVDALLVPPGDAKACAAAITRLLAEPDLCERLVAAGEARARDFAMDRLAERYVDLYERAIAARR